jgi:hypothetical protein
MAALCHNMKQIGHEPYVVEAEIMFKCPTKMKFEWKILKCCWSRHFFEFILTPSFHWVNQISSKLKNHLALDRVK